MPMTVEYRNGVQSSTISYSNMVIPEGITNYLKDMLRLHTYFDTTKVYIDVGELKSLV